MTNTPATVPSSADAATATRLLGVSLAELFRVARRPDLRLPASKKKGGR